jgi:hypothetical protein
MLAGARVSDRCEVVAVAATRSRCSAGADAVGQARVVDALYRSSQSGTAVSLSD